MQSLSLKTAALRAALQASGNEPLLFNPKEATSFAVPDEEQERLIAELRHDAAENNAKLHLENISQNFIGFTGYFWWSWFVKAIFFC